MSRSINDKQYTLTAISNPSTATTTSVIAAQGAGRVIKVHSCFLVVAGANSLTFKSDATSISGTNALAANGGLVLPHNPEGWFKTAPNEALNLTTTAAVATGVTINYSVE